MLREVYAAAGLGHFSSGRVTAVFIGALALLGLSLFRATDVLGVSVAGVALGAVAIYEGLRIVSQQREQSLVSALPELIESIAAGVSSGQDLSNALFQQAEHGPKALLASMKSIRRQADEGHSLEYSLVWLQAELGSVYADQLVQLLLVSLTSGGSGLVANLNSLGQIIRGQAALESELAAKQGWVTGTAKLGLAAPWLIVAFLNARPEAHSFYSSSAGFLLLVGGLAICIVAYLMIQAAGKLPRSVRVFTHAK